MTPRARTASWEAGPYAHLNGPPTRRICARLAGALVAGALGACALVTGSTGCGYHLGYRMPERVQRLAVPVFRNDTFPLRREIEFDLTRAVRQELELRTDVQLVSSAEAEAVLEGVILSFKERVLTEGPLDRIDESSLAVAVRMRLRRADGTLLFERLVRDDAAYSRRDGETLEDARRRAIQDIAERIVVYLEEWD